MSKWTELEEKCAKMTSRTKEVEKSLSEALAKKTAAENMVDQLNNKVVDSESERTALDTNLKIERDWRTSLQEESVKDKEKVAHASGIKASGNTEKGIPGFTRKICGIKKILFGARNGPCRDGFSSIQFTTKS